MSRVLAVRAAAMLAALAVLPYVRSIVLPWISDDYLVINVARHYGGAGGWSALFADPLYRCRTTLVELTWWLDRTLGPDAQWFRAISIAVHTANVLLVALLGGWKFFGWAVSVPAAGFFALHEIKQEAVIWYAAAPELLVFFFCLLTLHAFLAWMEQPRARWLIAVVAAFAAALLSKESAVVLPPALAVLLLIERRRDLRDWAPLAPMGVLCAVYLWAIFDSSGTHYHMHDGTFALGPHFLETVAISTGRLFWFWGLLALAAIAVGGAWRRHARVLIFAAIWIPLTLLPYSFLTYMNRVPSRATYLASLGVAMIAGAAWVEAVAGRRRWLPAAVVAAAVVHNAGYIIVVKHAAFVERAAPTERLIREAQTGSGPISLEGFAYTGAVGESALAVAAPQALPRLKKSSTAEATRPASGSLR